MEPQREMETRNQQILPQDLEYLAGEVMVQNLKKMETSKKLSHQQILPQDLDYLAGEVMVQILKNLSNSAETDFKTKSCNTTSSMKSRVSNKFVSDIGATTVQHKRGNVLLLIENYKATECSRIDMSQIWRYKCNKCNQQFPSQGLLQKHIESKHIDSVPDRLSECAVSPAKFADVGLLQKRKSCKRPYKCKLCGKSFRSASNRSTHMMVHTGKRPYPCKVCGKAFTRSNHLKEHLRIHTGEKPYKCSMCKGAFSSKRNLKAHFRVHTREKPFQCSVCQRRFSQRSNMTHHQRYCMKKHGID